MNRYVVTFDSARGIDGVRALRWLLKVAGRRLGLIAIDAYEDRSAPLELSNKVADEFKALRDEVVAERAARLTHGDMNSRRNPRCERRHGSVAT